MGGPHGPEQIERDAKNLGKRIPGCVREHHLKDAQDFATKLFPCEADWFMLLTAWSSKAGFAAHLEGPARVSNRALALARGVHRVRCGRIRGLGEEKAVAVSKALKVKSTWWALCPSNEAGWFWLMNRWLPHLRVHTQFGE